MPPGAEFTHEPGPRRMEGLTLVTMTLVLEERINTDDVLEDDGKRGCAKGKVYRFIKYPAEDEQG